MCHPAGKVVCSVWLTADLPSSPFLKAEMLVITVQALCNVTHPIVLGGVQGLRWNADPVGGHMFPRLRLAAKPNLVQLSGGMGALPITDAKVHLDPYDVLAW